MKIPEIFTIKELGEPVYDLIENKVIEGTLVVKLKRRTKDQQIEYLQNKCHELLSENHQLKKGVTMNAADQVKERKFTEKSKESIEMEKRLDKAYWLFVGRKKGHDMSLGSELTEESAFKATLSDVLVEHNDIMKIKIRSMFE